MTTDRIETRRVSSAKRAATINKQNRNGRKNIETQAITKRAVKRTEQKALSIALKEAIVRPATPTLEADDDMDVEPSTPQRKVNEMNTLTPPSSTPQAAAPAVIVPKNITGSGRGRGRGRGTGRGRGRGTGR